MGSIATDERDGVLILAIDRPPVNALDVDTLHELADALDGAHDRGALVLTGTGSIFSAGADLVRVLQADDAYIDAGIEALSRCFESLFVFPRPAIAAVNGHALAGGCVLACGCDYRVMASGGGRIGAIELSAGVPFPSWALELVRFSINNQYLQEILLFGRAYEPEEALRKGLIDEMVPDDRVMERALELARRLAMVPAPSFSLTKMSLRRPSVDLARRGAAASDDAVKKAWRSSEVRDAIRRQLESLGKG